MAGLRLILVAQDRIANPKGVLTPKSVDIPRRQSESEHVFDAIATRHDHQLDLARKFVEWHGDEICR